MALIEDYTLYRELRHEGVPLANSAHLGDGVAAALWNRQETAITRYEAPNHHTLSLYIAGGDQIRWKRGRNWIPNDGPGTICVMPHDVTTEWAVDGWIHLFHLYIPRPAFDRAVIEALDADPGLVELTEQIYIRDPAIEGMIRACAQGLDWDEAADRVALSHAGRAMIATLVSRFTSRAPNATRALGGLSPAVGRRLVEFIDQHLDAALSIDDLAQEADLSPFHFARAFKRTMGEGPHRFVTRRRIERARELLVSGISPAEAALACGFSGQSHFTQRFREFTGITPAAFVRGQ
jgi:AraC family transcriptional regulator